MWSHILELSTIPAAKTECGMVIASPPFYVRCMEPSRNPSQGGQNPSFGPISPIRSGQLNFGALKVINSQSSDRILNGFPTVTLIWGHTHVREKLKI